MGAGRGGGARRTDSGPAHSQSRCPRHFHSRHPSESARECVLPSGRGVRRSRPGVHTWPRRVHVTQAAAADERILCMIVARSGVRCAVSGFLMRWPEDRINALPVRSWVPMSSNRLSGEGVCLNLWELGSACVPRCKGPANTSELPPPAPAPRPGGDEIRAGEVRLPCPLSGCLCSALSPETCRPRRAGFLPADLLYTLTLETPRQPPSKHPPDP